MTADAHAQSTMHAGPDQDDAELERSTINHLSWRLICFVLRLGDGAELQPVTESEH